MNFRVWSLGLLPRRLNHGLMAFLHISIFNLSSLRFTALCRWFRWNKRFCLCLQTRPGAHVRNQMFGHCDKCGIVWGCMAKGWFQEYHGFIPCDLCHAETLHLKPNSETTWLRSIMPAVSANTASKTQKSQSERSESRTMETLRPCTMLPSGLMI